MDNKILGYIIFNNSVLDYLISLAIIAAGIFITWIFRHIILRGASIKAKKLGIKIEELAGIGRTVLPFVHLGIFYLALMRLDLSARVARGADIAAAVLLTLFIIRSVIKFLVHFASIYWRRDEDAVKRQIFSKLFPVVQVFVWVMGIIFLLENLGFRISTLVAGLGLGGVAVALASQAVLKDVFSYFVILFDRPFELNDFIVLSPDFMGTIESVGIKTTRIRSVNGELLLISNNDLTSSRIKNYKFMERRRVQFEIKVSSKTNLEKLREIPGIIASIIKGADGTLFERAHFASFGDLNLVIQVVYYVLSGDYDYYMDIQQKINYAILEEFEKRGIQVPSPS